MKSSIAETTFQGSSPFQVEACVKLIGHPDTAVYLYELRGHFVQVITQAGFGK